MPKYISKLNLNQSMSLENLGSDKIEKLSSNNSQSWHHRRISRKTSIFMINGGDSKDI